MSEIHHKWPPPLEMKMILEISLAIIDNHHNISCNSTAWPSQGLKGYELYMQEPSKDVSVQRSLAKFMLLAISMQDFQRRSVTKPTCSMHLCGAESWRRIARSAKKVALNLLLPKLQRCKMRKLHQKKLPHQPSKLAQQSAESQANDANEIHDKDKKIRVSPQIRETIRLAERVADDYGKIGSLMYLDKLQQLCLWMIVVFSAAIVFCLFVRLKGFAVNVRIGTCSLKRMDGLYGLYTNL